MMAAGGLGLDPVIDAAMARFAVTGDWSESDRAIDRARALRAAATPGRRVIIELGLAAILLCRAQFHSTGVQARLDEAVGILPELRAGQPLAPDQDLVTRALLCAALCERLVRAASLSIDSLFRPLYGDDR
jgi:hypothetical protein